MRIVVTTPTGNVGSHLVPKLLRAGVRPVVLVRDTARLAADVRVASEVIELDQTDVDAVVRATAGADALHWVAPSTGADDPIEGYDALGAVAAAAVEANAIPRVVFQSSVGAEARGGFGEIDGLGRIEERLDATDASVVHLRCGYFTTNLLLDPDALASGVLTTQLPTDQRIPWVAPGDVAEVTALRLLSTDWSGRVTQGVLGPADLSFAEVAATLTEVTGRPFEAQQVGDEDVAAVLRSFGMTDAQVEGIVGMSRGLRGDFVPDDPRDLVSTTPTTLRAWAVDALADLA